MQYRRTFNTSSGKNPNPFSSLMSLLMFFGVVALVIMIMYGFVKILYLVAPILLVITLVINYRIVSDYLVNIFETFKTDLFMGVVKVAFNALFYPFVIGYLFIKALFYRKMGNIRKQFENQINQKQGEQYAEYEEISTEIGSEKTDTKPEEPIILDLPKPKEKNKSNPYDNLFDN